MKTTEIRSQFLEYFKSKSHAIVPSSTLIPYNDPTLLFTNAGMVPFKDVFLGKEVRNYTRATSSQRCVRAGGKHNDLENVGFTARHHTFFEMLGNFSFGDYFKREAIQFAWSFLTEALKLPIEKLWVTVYAEDDEAADIWLNEIGVDKTRFSRCGAEDNFWSMGDVGPCGPCTEIFYDHGADIPGGPPGSPAADGDRYIEIWNLVFMQYSRDAKGALTPLPTPSVDTGMGLERIAAVLQGVHNNYDIDLFQALISAIKTVLSVKEDKATLNSLRVIADHIRSTAFLISDGVLPGNEGRGYVLRRIIRRAVRHGHRLGARKAFFYRLVGALADEMGGAYPELQRQKKHIANVLLAEEEQFAKTLEQGLKILAQDMKNLQGACISGETVFRLYDTYGFPVDLTADIAREKGLTIDEAGFEACMAEQKQQSRAAQQFSTQALLKEGLNVTVATSFTGYQALTATAQVKALYNEAGDAVDCLRENGIVVLDKTPFYAESGGQVGDKGLLEFEGGCFEVVDTQKEKQAVLHLGHVTGQCLSVGMQVTAGVAQQVRKSVALNHSATHLLHAALKKLLGDHVQQKGSLVDGERLRFDFLHMSPLTPEEVTAVEHLVNQQIRENHTVDTALMSLDEAKDSGAMALFGEKYAEKVRVLTMGGFSKELCGGTHVHSTGEIGLFKILSETGIASGVRRIEAVTGFHATQFIEEQQQHLQAIADLLRTDAGSVADKVRQLLDKTKTLEKEVGKFQAKLASQQGTQLLDEAIDVGDGAKLLVKYIEGGNPKGLRELADQLKNKLGSAVILLAATLGEKVSILAAVTPDLTDRVKASALANFVAEQVGGKGGGRPDLAQAGGVDQKALPAALTSVKVWVEEKF